MSERRDFAHRQDMGRVLVASNRGPVSFSRDADGTLTARRGGGGLVSGLSSVAGAADLLWICAAMSDADRAAARHAPGGRLDLDGHDLPAAVQMLDIPPRPSARPTTRWRTAPCGSSATCSTTPRTSRGFGPGFARDWESYRDYNAAFAKALADSAGPDGGRAMVQDYHLALVPGMLARMRPDVRIAHFSHTPWAPPDYFRILPDPVGRELLEGMLGADHAGFLTQRWADAFLDCCEEILGAEVDRAGYRVSYRGHVCGVGVHPLGVDAAGLRRRSNAADVEAHVTALTEATRGRQLIVRIDRTELSKNIVRGLAAYRELLAAHPELHGKVTHLAFAYPSRHDLAEYRAYTDSVQQIAREITEEFGTPGWEPLILEVKDDYARSLAAYRVADVIVVNPIRDGMNLVAKEAPIVSDRDCALVLSREAGACAELGKDALVVNPYDVTATAQAMYQGLTMPRPSAAGAARPWPRPPRPCRRTGGWPTSSARWAEPPTVPRSSAGDRAVTRPGKLTGSSGSARPDQPSSPASQPSRAATPSGPSTTRSLVAASSVTSAEPLHTATPGIPSPRSSPTARNAGMSPRSSPQNSTAREARSEMRDFSAAPLSIPRGRSSITIRPGCASRPSASASCSSAGRSRRSAASGSAARLVCTATAWPLSSVQVPSGAPAAARTPGSRSPAAATPGGAGRAATSPPDHRSKP